MAAGIEPAEPRAGGSPQTRRTFCVEACRLASVVALTPVIQACSGGSPTSPSGGGASATPLPVIAAPVNNGTIVVALGGSPLANVGGAARLQSPGGQFLVARTGQNAAVALTATCTHEQCTITGFENSRYVCPCHGSQFNTSGGVANGPANQPLREFGAAIVGDTLTITL